MKRVLMTNLYFASYTGSELHIWEIARQFEKNGYEVTIAVFQKAYPLLEKQGTIKIVDVLNEELAETDFDIIFTQHYSVLDFLCCKYKITYKNLIISKLSVINDLENLPMCTPDADLILCVSQECAEQVYKEIGVDSRVRIFKNSVSEEFFSLGCMGEYPTELKRIAVISNHVPEEVMELSQSMSGKWEIDYIGVQYSPRLVDAELLGKYDLVITIGRTVQQCFASKTPVYVYDYFGGPGYINQENFKVAEENNFSGRGGFGKKTSFELKEDIEANYEKNLLNLERLYSIAENEYSYDSNFDKILQELTNIESQESKELVYFNEAAKRCIALYSSLVPAYALPTLVTSQLYIDYGKGLNEADSIKWNSRENYIITKKIQIDGKIKSLRFDPCNMPAKCYIHKIYINGKLKEEYSEKEGTFLDFDSQFLIELSEEENELDALCVEIVYKFRLINWSDTLYMCNKEIGSLKKENTELQSELEATHNQVEEIKEYYKVTPKNIIRRVKGRFKR